MEAYLDNAATTRVLPEVAELMTRVMTVDYGNPSSLHGKGFEAEKYIRTASEQIAATLKCDASNIVFTSGGTESNNQALIGTALANKRRGKHIVTTSFEHPSVHEPLLYLEQQGFEITFIPVESDGSVSKDVLVDALRDDTILVSIMLVNNEIGAIQDIEGLAAAVKKHDPDIVFHTDAIQAYGKLRIKPAKSGIDLMSVSGHKLHGPKGIGFLYVREGTKLHPYIHGGHQQKNRRSGTENVPGIAGLGLAAEMAYRSVDENYDRIGRLRDDFTDKLRQIDGVIVHADRMSDMSTDMRTSPSDRMSDMSMDMQISSSERSGVRHISPYIISIGVEGVKSEVLLHALEDKGIYVSSGSACSSNHPGISDTLTAVGIPKEYLDSTIRISLSRFTTDEELDHTVNTLQELLPVLRRFTKR